MKLEEAKSLLNKNGYLLEDVFSRKYKKGYGLKRLKMSDIEDSGEEEIVPVKDARKPKIGDITGLEPTNEDKILYAVYDYLDDNVPRYIWVDNNKERNGTGYWHGLGITVHDGLYWFDDECDKLENLGQNRSDANAIANKIAYKIEGFIKGEKEKFEEMVEEILAKHSNLKSFIIDTTVRPSENDNNISVDIKFNYVKAYAYCKEDGIDFSELLDDFIKMCNEIRQAVYWPIQENLVKFIKELEDEYV